MFNVILDYPNYEEELRIVKETTSVRKLVIWKTNKEELDSNYPAYVVHWTDYSPDRKDPLKREVRLASAKKTATAIAEQMLEKNIKKGWEKSTKD